MPKRVSTIVLTLLVAVAVVSAYLLVQYYVGSLAEQSQFETLIQMKDNASADEPSAEQSSLDTGSGSGPDGGILPQYRELAAASPDMVGWIKIPDTIVDYPVMQSPEDPQYYLSRNFNGARTDSGSIFMDARNNPGIPQNLILYGHNMKIGTMFGVLSNFQAEAFARKHKVIYFDTLTEERRYEVIACFTTAVSGTSNNRTIYDFVDLKRAADLEAFSALVQAHRASGDAMINGSNGDFLTLSTCTGDSDTRRLVVVAQRVKD